MAVEANTGRAWLSSLSRFGIRPGLERTERVLQYFGDPQEHLKFFHVAGTNGKGSVCACLYQLLRSKHRVGLFTSPAFDGYQGRFIVNGDTIPQRDFERLALSVRDAVAIVSPDDALTEFEVLTVMAILYFAQQDVEAVVWETGLGGRYDSTNVVSPVVTAITNVGLDHVQILGPTIRHIAADKSGIIKKGKGVITAASGAALDVIRTHATRQSAKLYVNRIHFGFSKRIREEQGSWMDYRGVTGDLYDVPVVLEGGHQCENAAVALAMYEVAVAEGQVSELTSREVRDALKRVVWPGRFDVLRTEENIIVFDGAHNPEGARTLAKALGEFGRKLESRRLQSPGGMPQWTLVIGVLRDKDVKGILRPMLPLANDVFVITPANPRALEAEELTALVREQRPELQVHSAASASDAIEQAALSTQTHFICCFGSLYTVDEARKAMETMQHSGKQGR